MDESYAEKVRFIITEYIESLSDLEEIEGRIEGGRPSYTRWKDAEQEYLEKDWDEDKYKQFVYTTKEVTEEDTDRVSESYFNIVEPRDLTEEFVEQTLSENERDGEGEGFVYNKKDEGVFKGTYVYTSIDTEITEDADIRRLRSEEAVPFEIDAEEKLVIVKSTYPAYVKKMQGAVNETAMKVEVCGDLTHFEDTANEKVNSFLNSLNREDKE